MHKEQEQKLLDNLIKIFPQMTEQDQAATVAFAIASAIQNPRRRVVPALALVGGRRYGG